MLGVVAIKMFVVVLVPIVSVGIRLTTVVVSVVL